MTTPVIILTDHLNGATGTLTIEEGHCCHFQCVSASTLGGGDWVQAKIEWSITETSEPYNSGMRGFNFFHYCPTAGTYTVTCTVTNVNGETGSGQCVVTVSASTRTTINVNEGDDLYTVWSANTGANKEFVLAGNVTVFGQIAPGSNNVFRSSIAGTKRTLSHTAFVNTFELSDVATGFTAVDLQFIVGPSAVNVCFSLAGTNCNVIDCIVDTDVCDLTIINCASNPRGVLIQNTTTTVSVWQNIWYGNADTSRMMSIYGGAHIGTSTNTERPLRGHGTYISLVDTLLQQDAAKDPLSIMAGSYFYLFRTEVVQTTSTGGGAVILVGHTASTYAVSDIVVDRCLLRFSNRGGQLRLGPNTSTCTRVVMRNNIFRNVVLMTQELTTLKAYHNTFYFTFTPASPYGWIVNNTGVSVTDMVLVGNLVIWSTGPSSTISINSIDDTATEFTEIANNVTGTPSDQDVKITDAVNGNKNEQYATFNARSNGSGNIRKTVAINTSNFRPDNTEDTDISFSPHGDMGIFQEDYHGNPRLNATWLAGAVDVNPVLYFSLSTSGGSLFIKTLGG